MSMSEDNLVDKFHILTIRLIRSFHHRNLKNIIIRDVSKNMSVKDFKALINEGINEVCFILANSLHFTFLIFNDIFNKNLKSLVIIYRHHLGHFIMVFQKYI